jgi:hypothetical protein
MRIMTLPLSSLELIRSKPFVLRRWRHRTDDGIRAYCCRCTGGGLDADGGRRRAAARLEH